MYTEDEPNHTIQKKRSCEEITSEVHLSRTDQSRWKLLRQDDNGNRFEISRFSSRSEALEILAEFEKRAHKQTYWLEACDEETAQL